MYNCHYNNISDYACQEIIDNPALPIIHRDRDEREKRTVLKLERERSCELLPVVLVAFLNYNQSKEYSLSTMLFNTEKYAKRGDTKCRSQSI